MEFAAGMVHITRTHIRCVFRVWIEYAYIFEVIANSIRMPVSFVKG